MRIGIDGRALQVRYQGEPWSGVGQYTYHLLHALFELDKENEYIIWYNGLGKIVVPDFSAYPNVHIHRTHWPNKVLNVGMKVFKWQFFPPLRLRGGEEGLRAVHNAPQPPLILRGGDRIDIFFMPNLNFIALPATVKLVTVVHDLSFEHFSEFFSYKSRLWHRAINPRALLGRADHVIAVSEHTKDDVVETYGIPGEKVTVVYSGIMGRGPSSERPEDGPPYILYLGALEPRKNIMGIIEAFEFLHRKSVDSDGIRRSGLHLVLAGLSTPYVKELKKRIAQSRLRERIILKENPTEDEKTKLYTAAHVFVYPSYYEGFGFPPLEAMSYGVPVVASSASSVPEICGDAALLVSPWSVQEIKEGMRILLEDDQMRKTYIEAGYARVKEFSWEKCAKETLAIFKNIVSV